VTRRTVVIADDEPLARKLLREMLDARGDVDVVAEAGSGELAVEAILAHAPDLLFLDIQMPELDGFAVLDRLKPRQIPAVVFVTAYDSYALRAFDAAALDYLLKPYDAERLNRAVNRALSRLQERASSSLMDSLGDVLSRLRGRTTRLPVTVDGRVKLIDAASIEWLEADGKFVRLHVGRETLPVRQSLSSIVEQLDSAEFVRVHRAAVVNLAAIREVQPWFHGDYVLALKSGAKVATGRAYRDQIRQLLGSASTSKKSSRHG
jgi:two-component system LytT family response regulator